MAAISPVGRDWGSTVNWDALGKLYASFAIAWTVILFAGTAWLATHQHLPYLKMRNIPLAVAAVSFLHVYLVKILLAYTTNGHFLCSAEFWIMSIYLPFGTALFQANGMQLLSISDQQRKLLQGDRSSIRELRRARRGILGVWSRWRALSTLQRTYVCIATGMLFQVVVTAAIYGTNRKLQGHWGKTPKATGQALCRKGPEWIPSAMWQLFWSCLYGPYLLYKLRNVRDTHHWRLQTMLCVISGFPGVPLWLAAVFTPGTKWKWVNRYWVPPMWLAPGIVVMQAVTIFFPLYEAYRSRRLSRDTLSIIRQWENRSHWDKSTLGSGSRPSVTTRTSMSNTKSFTSNNSAKHSDTSDYRKNEMYTIGALEKALTVNPTPLLHFAATKDFTAENIIFLIAVRDFKATWAAGPLNRQTRAALFDRAVDIYVENVSEKFAEFPINIEGWIRTQLEAVFEPAVNNLEVESPVSETFNKITPFESAEVPLSPLKSPLPIRDRELGGSSFPSSPSTPRFKVSGDSEEIDRRNGAREADNDDSSPPVAGFDGTIFDTAEKSIKYLVLTNTWRKFVTEMRDVEPRASEETLA